MINNNIDAMALMDAMPVCIKLFDDKGNIIYVNKFGRREHHLSNDQDISNWKWIDTVKDEYRVEVERKFSEILKGSAIEYTEFEHTEEGSNHKWCSGAFTPVKDKDNRITGIIFYSIDISSKKEKEKELAEKMQELQTINSYMTARELKMIELKTQIEELKNRK